ncbi:MAG: CDP-alcohol phosphatidyltransferase family protein [Bacteroidaceae bacterium]|nr:CDP-alcohol phosphatidyltransferase family protein [Bacteroidaceae bacterium]
MSENKNITATYKSLDTEEWLDIHFTRPIGYRWALLFNHFGIHPNVVTILSIFIGIGAGVMFYHTDLLSNVIGVLLLMWANFYDSADGQLARMSGKKTQWGRILDGAAGDFWFISIYLAISLRMMNDNIPFTSMRWGYWIILLAAFSGIYCHARQCQSSDYYRNIHLFFLKGTEGSELSSSDAEREKFKATPWKGNLWWKMFLWSYINYTTTQERMSPVFQRLKRRMAQAYPDGRLPQELCDEFRRGSLPLMKYANILTFNTRAIALYISCLANIPWAYLLFEIVVMTSLWAYMVHRHEAHCLRMIKWIDQHEG